MSPALAKAHLRVFGVDDGPFRRDQRFAPLAGVLLSTPSQVETITRGRIRIDGTDATQAITRMVVRSGHREQVRAVLLDGITMGGFNVVDLAALHRDLDLPIVSVTRRTPEFDRIRDALRTYFPADWRARWRKVIERPLFSVPTGGRPIWAATVGCRRVDALAILRRTTVVGYWPEPLRLAHLVARALGSSRHV